MQRIAEHANTGTLSESNMSAGALQQAQHVDVFSENGSLPEFNLPDDASQQAQRVQQS